MDDQTRTARPVGDGWQALRVSDWDGGKRPRLRRRRTTYINQQLRMTIRKAARTWSLYQEGDEIGKGYTTVSEAMKAAEIFYNEQLNERNP